MRAEELLTLALRACEDRDAQQVLGDAVLDSGWSDERVTLLLTERNRYWLYDSGDQAVSYRTRTRDRGTNLSRKNARNPTRRWCRAVAAVLLFGGWSMERWPIRSRCGVEHGISRFDGLDAWIPMQHSGPGTLFGIDRATEPLRLAGVTVESQKSLQEQVIEAAQAMEKQSSGEAIRRLWEHEMDSMLTAHQRMLRRIL